MYLTSYLMLKYNHHSQKIERLLIWDASTTSVLYEKSFIKSHIMAKGPSSSFGHNVRLFHSVKYIDMNFNLLD